MHQRRVQFDAAFQVVSNQSCRYVRTATGVQATFNVWVQFKTNTDTRRKRGNHRNFDQDHHRKSFVVTRRWTTHSGTTSTFQHSTVWSLTESMGKRWTNKVVTLFEYILNSFINFKVSRRLFPQSRMPGSDGRWTASVTVLPHFVVPSQFFFVWYVEIHGCINGHWNASIGSYMPKRKKNWPKRMRLSHYWMDNISLSFLSNNLFNSLMTVSVITSISCWRRKASSFDTPSNRPATPRFTTSNTLRRWFRTRTR